MGKDRRSPDGLSYQCRACIRRDAKAKYDADPKSVIKRIMKYQKDHPERESERMRGVVERKKADPIRSEHRRNKQKIYKQNERKRRKNDPPAPAS
jgi:hypothetical protein